MQSVCFHLVMLEKRVITSARTTVKAIGIISGSLIMTSTCYVPTHRRALCSLRRCTMILAPHRSNLRGCLGLPIHIGTNRPRHQDSVFTPGETNIVQFSLFSTSTTTVFDNVVPKEYEKTYHLHGTTTPDNLSGTTVQTTKLQNDSDTTTAGSQQQCHIVQTDLPKKMGGNNLAPQPVELLLASLIGCTQATALFVSRQMYKRTQTTTTTTTAPAIVPLLLDRLEMDITAIRDERGSLHLPINENPPVPSKLQYIKGTVHVYMVTTTNNKNSKRQNASIPSIDLQLLKEQTEFRCPIANMITASGCQIDIEWIDGNVHLC